MTKRQKPAGKRRKLGSMKGQIKIYGDIIAPASDPGDWEAISSPDRVLDPLSARKQTRVPRKRSK